MTWGNLSAVGLVVSLLGAAAMGSDIGHTVKTLDGKEVDLNDAYDGKVLLIVNVASRCGLTPQYDGLQALHEKYQEQGLRVLGFPCNQFGAQEPGTAEEIREFCSTNYSVTFDMFAKIDVNGDGASPLYQQLTAKDTNPKGAGNITWNFEKFVIGRDGHVVARFAPRTSPSAPELIETIETALGK
jgi:glutathione peroxidase